MIPYDYDEHFGRIRKLKIIKCVMDPIFSNYSMIRADMVLKHLLKKTLSTHNKYSPTACSHCCDVLLKLMEQVFLPVKIIRLNDIGMPLMFVIE